VAALLLATLLVHALWAAAEQVTGADLWWAMAAGRYIVEHGAIPARDVFSYTFEGAPWSNGEWLSQVVFFELYRHWGGTAVALFKFGVVTSLFALAAWIGWRRSGSLVFAVGAAVLAAYVCRPYLDIRPQLFLFLCTLAVLAVIEAYRQRAGAWVLGLLPLIMVAWANLHYSFVFGAGLLLLYAAGEGGKSVFGLPGQAMARERTSRLGAAAVLAVLAALVNPHHVKAFLEPFTLVGTQAIWRQEIIEWQPAVLFVEERFNPALFGYLVVGQMVIAAAALMSARRRFDVGDGLLVALTATMALSARRFVPLFALVSAPFLARNLAIVRARLLPRSDPELATWRSGVAVGLLAVAASGFLLVRAVPEARKTFAPGLFEGLTYAEFFPKSAVEFLRLNPLPARLFHIYTWGGYVMYDLPEQKVFIDGRAQAVYPGEFYLESDRLESGAEGWEDVLDRWQVSVVLWPSGFAGGKHVTMLQQLVASPHWLRVYNDGHSAVFAHVERARPWIDAFRSFALVYPDDPGAQLFLANVYLESSAFVRARDQFQGTLGRFPRTRTLLEQTEQRLLESARTTNAALAWFGVGFYRDVLGDRAGAADAFRLALERGLAEPQASYAREALGFSAPRAS
jgi:hypothetical protein